MRKLILITAVFCVLSSGLLAQKTVGEVVDEIEKNNTTLLAFRYIMEAQKLENKTDIFLQNPEVGFNYLWGNSTEIGNRKDFSIKQSFDFPTAYSYKNQISDLKNEQVDLNYQKQLRTIQLGAKLICYDLVYINALKYELEDRLVHAQSIFESYKAKFELGEISILEFNKSKLNLLNIRSQIETLEIERSGLLIELSVLNAGIDIDFSIASYEIFVIPINFEQWYLMAETNNPILSWLKKEIEISKKQVGLNRANSLPKIEAGYMSEIVVGQKFKGVSVGLSIPLWENKNKVKYAKANAIALSNVVRDNKLQFYNKLKSLHAKAIGLQNNFTNYQSNVLAINQSNFLKKALDNGELSLIDYMLELSFQYESITKLFELERDLKKTVAELNLYMQ